MQQCANSIYENVHVNAATILKDTRTKQSRVLNPTKQRLDISRELYSTDAWLQSQHGVEIELTRQPQDPENGSTMPGTGTKSIYPFIRQRFRGVLLAQDSCRTLVVSTLCFFATIAYKLYDDHYSQMDCREKHRLQYVIVLGGTHVLHSCIAYYTTSHYARSHIIINIQNKFSTMARRSQTPDVSIRAADDRRQPRTKRALQAPMTFLFGDQVW